MIESTVRMDNFKKDWAECKFDEVLEIRSGKNQKNVENPNGKYPIYGSSGVFGRADAYLSEAKTVVIGRKGTINRPIYVKEKYWNVDTAFGLHPSRILNSRYLFYFCLGFNFHSLDKSTTIPSLAKRDLLKIDIPLPPLPIQRVIVKKLEALFSSLDAAVNDLQKTQGQLEIYRQVVLKKAFEGDWEIKLLDEVADWGSGGTPSRKNEDYFRGNIPWIKTGELVSKFIFDTEEKITQEAISDSSAKIFPKGAVAMAMYGATIGKTSILGNEMATNQACAVAICKPYMFSEYLYYYLLSKRQLFINLGAGGAQPNISQTIIKAQTIYVPPLEVQHQIVKEIESRLSVIEEVEKQVAAGLKQAEALRHSILKKAFEGRLLSAEELEACRRQPDYEPASELLKRLKIRRPLCSSIFA